MKKLSGIVLGLLLTITSSLAIGGSTTGPRYHNQTLLPGQTYFYNLWFEKYASAGVIVRGAGNSDIDCTVFDRFGNIVSQDNDNTSTCVLTWFPNETSPFRIIVANVGGEPTTYLIQTN